MSSQSTTHYSDDSITSANVTGPPSTHDKESPITNARPVPEAEEIELIPGTEILNDPNGVYSQHGVLETSQHIILLPKPSNDPHDPLVSAQFWK